jgi:hypothetical protein
MNERSARRVRSNSDITADLRRLRLVLACATCLLLVALASAPDTAVAQVGERSPAPSHARHVAVADAPRGAVLDGALEHILGHGAHAGRAPALSPDEHDIDTERDSDSRAYKNTQGHPSHAAYCQSGNPLRRCVRVRSSLRFVAFEFAAAPANDYLSRAPPHGCASARHAA